MHIFRCSPLWQLIYFFSSNNLASDAVRFYVSKCLLIIVVIFPVYFQSISFVSIALAVIVHRMAKIPRFVAGYRAAEKRKNNYFCPSFFWPTFACVGGKKQYEKYVKRGSLAYFILGVML